MADEREALLAIRALNSTKLNGNNINVEVSTSVCSNETSLQDFFFVKILSLS